MCQFVTKISQNHYGQLTKCEKCNSYNLSYNNILFEFTYEEFENFKLFLKTIEPEFYEANSSQYLNRRNIPINTFQENLFLVFSNSEIQDLKKMVLEPNEQIENYDILSSDSINYKIQLN